MEGYRFSREAHDALQIHHMVARLQPDGYHVPPLRFVEDIGQAVDDMDAVVWVSRQHARAFDFHGQQHEPPDDEANRHQDDNPHQRALRVAPDEHPGQQGRLLRRIRIGSHTNLFVKSVPGDCSSGNCACPVRTASVGRSHAQHSAPLGPAHAPAVLQHLRKKFQKQQRVLAQVSIAEQKYRPESNSVDYTFLIERGPVVVVYTQGFHVSHGVLKREIPVYQENALDDDLLNEGKRNLLNYLQSRGHFDATVDFQKETGSDTIRIIYRIDPGPVHKLELVEITGNKYFSRQILRQRLQIQPAGKVFSPGRYSEALLRNDVAGLQALYVSNGFRHAKIQTKVDDDYRHNQNHLAVHIQIEEGPQTLVGAFQIVGNQKIEAKAFPEMNTTTGQPYSEQNLAGDRETILNYYFNHGFPNAILEITTNPSPAAPDREDVIYTIQEGEQFFVNHVMVAGLDHTRDYVVQREIQVAGGQALSQGDLLDTQTKLYDLGIFSQVDTAVQNPEGSDPQKNVLVQVQEAKRYTFTYGLGLEFETGLPSSTNSGGSTGVSPRVGFDVTRLNVGGRNQTLIFQSHVGTLQQRGVVSYEIPKIFNNHLFKLFFTIFYDNSLNVATFTSQRLEGKIDLRQQIGKQQVNHSTSITYRFDYRRVKASNLVSNFSPAEFSLFSLPAHVGGPGFTFIRDQRDNPIESTKGQYFTLDAFAASSYVGSQSDYGRALGQDSTYYAFGRPNHKFVFARSTTLRLEQPDR